MKSNLYTDDSKVKSPTFTILTAYSILYFNV